MGRSVDRPLDDVADESFECITDGSFALPAVAETLSGEWTSSLVALEEGVVGSGEDGSRAACRAGVLVGGVADSATAGAREGEWGGDMVVMWFLRRRVADEERSVMGKTLVWLVRRLY